MRGKVLDLAGIEDGDEGWEVLQPLARSALLAAPHTGQGWVRREYVFSRFLADCARSAGFDAIRYGSTKLDEGANWVLLDPPDDLASRLSLEGWQALDAPSATHRY